LTLGSLGLCVEAGIDVSHWQGIVDWGKVKRAGVAFAYIKATEGSTHEDRRFQSNIKHARSEGLVAGAYHFSRPDTNADIDQPCKDARQEAERFLRSYRPQRGDLKPILDLERGLGPDDNYNARWCLEWLSYVEREVATPMVYAARWVVNKYLKNADDDLLSELSSYPAVWASYNKGSSPERFPEKVWTDWVVWQYTGRGSCDGIKGRVDLNWSAGGALDRMVID
jgi:lysozyme